MTGTDTVDFVGHLVTDVFGEANKTAKSLQRMDDGFSLTARIMGIVHLISKSIDRDHADVRALSREAREGGLVVERRKGQTIEDEDNVLHGKETHGTWCTRGVEDTMHGMLDMLPTTFAWILMLVLGFRLPIVDVIGPEDILDEVADDFSAIVRDELAHGTATSDFILKGVDELGFELDTMDTDDLGFLSDKNHDVLGGTECGNVGSDDITRDGFIAAIHIVSGERGLEGVADGLPMLWEPTSPLRGVVVRVVDSIHVSKGKEFAIGFEVTFGWSGMGLAT
jgi:hypothetical protein